MSVRHFRNLLDLGTDSLANVLDRAAFYKTHRGTPLAPRPLEGKSVAIVLEKSSTRTRISFEVGIHELGGTPLTMMGRDLQLGRGEPLSDTARMFSRYLHAVVFRTFGQDRVETLAAHSTIPVINALSDSFHPCQLLADLQTVRQEFGDDWSKRRVAWIGDANNVANSWMLASALLGFELRIASPTGYRPTEEMLALAKGAGGQRILVTGSPEEAVGGADVVTTDVWASMGQEEESKIREKAFEGFRVTSALMLAAKSDAIFLHCLPAHRGEEVDAAVLEGTQSRVWNEAENRLHAQKALLEWSLGRD